MPNLNRVMLMGNLTRDPELRHTPNNTAVAQIGLAINRRWRNQNGEQQEETTFVDCEAWGRTAEVINQYFRKGRPIYIEGRLKLDQWEDKQGGGKRSKLKVVVESFEFLERGDGAAAGGGHNESSGGGEEYAPSSDTPPGYQHRGAPPQRSTQPPRGRGGAGGPPAQPHQPIEEDDIPF